MSQKIKIKARLSYPALFKAVPFEEGDTPKFKATFQVKKGSPEHDAIKKGYIAAAKAAWGEKWKAKLAKIKGNPNKFCVQDGDESDNADLAGLITVSAKSLTRPTVLDRDKTPLAAEDGRPYAGCYVVGILEFFAYKQGGISAGLKGVQFLKDGEAFAGGAPASEEEFDDLGEGADDEDEDGDFDDEDEDEAPKKKKKRAPVDVEEDDEDDEDAPPKKKKKKVVEEDDEDEDDEPAPKKKKKKAPVDEDEDDEEMLDEDDEDEAPPPKKKKKKVVEEDDEDDE